MVREPRPQPQERRTTHTQPAFGDAFHPIGRRWYGGSPPVIRGSPSVDATAAVAREVHRSDATADGAIERRSSSAIVRPSAASAARSALVSCVANQPSIWSRSRRRNNDHLRGAAPRTRAQSFARFSFDRTTAWTASTGTNAECSPSLRAVRSICCAQWIASTSSPRERWRLALWLHAEVGSGLSASARPEHRRGRSVRVDRSPTDRTSAPNPGRPPA